MPQNDDQRRRHGRGGDEDRGGDRSGEPRGTPTSPVEWMIAAAGGAVVLAAAAIMLYEAATSTPSPPELEMLVDSVVTSEHGWVVEFRARNHGSETAAELVVEGELSADTGTVETSTMTFRYVPGRATRRGGLVFTHDPSAYDLEIRATGYDRP